MLKMKITILSCFCVLLMIACSNPDKSKTSKEVNNTLNADSNFVYRNIQDISFMDTMILDDFINQNFRKLNGKEKIDYLYDYISQEDGSKISKDWIKQDLEAFIVARQERIGAFEPILIKVFGTDFTALVLVNLDENDKVHSGYPIFCTENSGPEISEDTLIVTRPKVRCTFSKNVINTEKLTGTIQINPNAKKDIFYIDKITYKTIISESGKFSTVKIDSIRYQEKFDLSEFQTY
jgi:hypothetical protein